MVRCAGNLGVNPIRLEVGACTNQSDTNTAREKNTHLGRRTVSNLDPHSRRHLEEQPVDRSGDLGMADLEEFTVEKVTEVCILPMQCRQAGRPGLEPASRGGIAGSGIAGSGCQGRRRRGRGGESISLGSAVDAWKAISFWTMAALRVEAACTTLLLRTLVV